MPCETLQNAPPMTVSSLYEERLAARLAASAQLASRDRLLAFVRVIVIIAGLVLLFIIPLLGFALIAAFIVLVVIHERTIEARRRYDNAARFYELGIARLTNSWSGKGIDGHELIEEHHPYSGDFDLFGRGSIYELLCIAATRAGRTRLGRWLSDPSQSVQEVVARQEAVRELRDEIDLREEMAIVAANVTADVEHGRIEERSRMPELVFATWERIAARGMALITGALAVVTIPSLIFDMAGVTHAQQVRQIGAFADVPALPLLIAIVIDFVLTRSMSARVAQIVSGVERAEPALALLTQLLGVLERRSFTSARMQALRATFDRKGETASKQIDRLRRLVALLDARRNQFFIPIGALLLWTTNLALSIERWRRESGQEITGWMESVGEIEALSSLASLAYEQPSFVMPEIVSEGPRFAAKGVGHPLIPADRRVTNDIALGDELRLLVVSGSNMSGKSTMQRSVGIAAVLALAGGPVCAESLRIAPMRIGASIRINDSLQEGASRFYAEILRIRQVLELAAGDRPLLFLLDEILAGTNSHDRRIGAEAVVRSLVKRGAIGMVSTHDLALADIADSLGTRAANVHFEDHMEEGRVAFDYRMRPGVVTKSNALALMRAVGIEV
jgi:hypothetical protein